MNLVWTGEVDVQVRILIYVVIAMFLGAILGLERELQDKPAGLRTHMLVAGATALLVALGDVMVGHFDRILGNQLIQSDPTRIIQAVITGVAFLGAGTIIRSRSDNQVEGLTTAASILFTAGIGVCVALEQLVLAAGVTLLGLITLRLVLMVEARVAKNR